MQAHSILDIPVPKVLAYCATADNPVESEYVIMEEARGTKLSEGLDTMDLKDQLAIVTELITIDQKFLSTSLNRYEVAPTHQFSTTTLLMKLRRHGALYYKEDSFPRCETTQVTASVRESLRTDVAKRFVIGPTVEREFWEKQRANIAIDRRPCMSASVMMMI